MGCGEVADRRRSIGDIEVDCKNNGDVDGYGTA